MFSRPSLVFVLLLLSCPITTIARPSQQLESRAATTTTTTTIQARSTTTRSSVTTTTTTAQYIPATCFREINTFPNGQTTTLCYDTTYYRSTDLGQVHNYQTTDLTKQCEASCVSDSRCTAYVLAMQLAADSDLATGVCFFYDHIPKPRSCSDGSKRRLFAGAKRLCTTSTTTTTSSTTTTTSVPLYTCTGSVISPCGASCVCFQGTSSTNYCVNGPSTGCNALINNFCTSNSDCMSGYVCTYSINCGKSGRATCQPANNPLCAPGTTSTTTTSTSTSTKPAIVAATQSIVSGAPGNPVPSYNCTTIDAPCGPVDQGDAGCFCTAGIDGTNYCVSQYADVCNQTCNSDEDCPTGYICEVEFYCGNFPYQPTCLQIDYPACAVYPGLNNLIPNN